MNENTSLGDVLAVITNGMLISLFILAINMSVIFSKQIKSMREDIQNISCNDRCNNRGNDGAYNPNEHVKPMKGDVFPKR